MSREEALQKHPDSPSRDNHAYRSRAEDLQVIVDAEDRAKYDGDLELWDSREGLKCCAPSAASDTAAERAVGHPETLCDAIASCAMVCGQP